MTEQTRPQWNTIAELCDRLRVSRPTVEAWIRDGRLEAVHVGRAIRIPEDSVVELDADLRQQVPVEPSAGDGRARPPASEPIGPKSRNRGP